MNDIIRKPMNDVIVPQNDIIRRVPNIPEPYITPSRKEEGDRIERNPFFEKPRKKSNEPLKNREHEKIGRSSALIWALVIVLLLGSGFMIANYFAKATVTVEPISRGAKLDHNFTAVKEGTTDEFAFKFVSLTEKLTKEVPATIEKKIQKKASGKVVIFNSYTSSAQRLVINTRLESPDHKIFRIEKSVVVPGATIVNGKVTIPGAVEVLVYADVPGKEYNIGASNFTLPGLKGDPRYTKFAAASKADSPIGGGFSGTIKAPSDEAVASAREDIKRELKKIAVEKVRAQIPPDVSFFPGSMIVKFEEVPQDFTKDAIAKIAVRATISVFFFDTKALTQKLVESVLPDEREKSFALPGMSTLTFSFIDPIDNVVLADLSKIRFHLTGETDFVGHIDSEKIRLALAGKNKKDFREIIVAQNNIYKADAVIRPMWKTVFPLDPAKITLDIMTK